MCFHIFIFSVFVLLYFVLCVLLSLCVCSCVLTVSVFPFSKSCMPETRSQRQRRALGILAMAPTNTNATATMAPSTKVTLISENVPFPAFTGDGSESVHDFIRRVQEECTRRDAISDDAKLAVIKSRISFEPTSHAGKLAKSDKFLQFTKFDDFTAALLNHFAGHSKLGATHSLLKVAQSATQVMRSTSDVYKAENFASSLSSELTNQLKDSPWFEDGKMTTENFKRVMSYFLFTLQLDSPTFAVASKVEFNPSDFIYDICKRMSEKLPPTSKPVHLAQPTQPRPSYGSSPQPISDQTPARGRFSSRQPPSARQPPTRHRSHSRHSRERNTTCHRCGLRGHIASFCRVTLDQYGSPQYDPEAFCTLHNRRGHSLADCRLHQQQLSSRPSCSSGNDSRPRKLDFT